MDVSLLTPGQQVGTVTGLVATADVGATVSFRNGRVVDSNPEGTPTTTLVDDATVEAVGWIALPPLADLHAHLDKDYTWERAGRSEGSLQDAIDAWGRIGEEHSYDAILSAGRRHLTAALESGVTAVRSHADYHLGGDPLRGVNALVQLREEFRGLVDLQVLAMQGPAQPDGLLRDTIAAGVDLIGGCPHLTDDPRADLERAVSLAESAGIGIDLHTDETLDPRSHGLLDLAERTRSWPEHMVRCAGHCVSLSMQDAPTRAATLDAVAEAGVHIITNPLTNLYLLGREHEAPMLRCIPPLREILAAGAGLAAGGDNVQDPFHPLGNADMVDVAVELVSAGRLTPDQAWQVASEGGRAAFGLPPARGRVGDVADLLLVRAAHVTGALAERAPDRVVIRDGRVVAVRRRSVSSLYAAAASARRGPAKPARRRPSERISAEGALR